MDTSSDNKHPAPLLSVIVCTYIRTHRLIECLRTLERQTLSADAFEIVVVSKDLAKDQRAALDEYSANTPLTIRHVEEQKRGLSVARNVGFRHSRGRFILYLDDDTLVDAECLKAHVDLLESTGAMCSGGKILPKFLTPPPAWLRNGHWPFLSLLDLGDEVMDFAFPANFPVGANVAFTRTVFERYGLFDEDLGMNGRKTAGGEESDLCYRIWKDGERLLYNPAALVHHCIESDKLSKWWLIRTAYRQGKGAVLFQKKHDSLGRILARNLRSFFDKNIGERLSSTTPSVSELRHEAFRPETGIPLAAGYFVQMFKELLS